MVGEKGPGMGGNSNKMQFTWLHRVREATTNKCILATPCAFVRIRLPQL